MNLIALNFIKQREACRLTAYQDSGGVWTIGYGATGSDIGPGVVWTQDQADENLASRLLRCEKTVMMLTVGLALSGEQYAALIAFEDNAGAGALSTSHLLAFVKAKNWLAACKAWAEWDHIKGVEILGLLKRRYLEAALFADGS